ncbi:hypothetical protein NOCA2350071 [metagenome]|uniref:Uncharacterized protein n=1 Tax=metagenome TaxID=256318 RepID=A0A2P2C3G9_9ZZZZ
MIRAATRVKVGVHAGDEALRLCEALQERDELLPLSWVENAHELAFVVFGEQSEAGQELASDWGQVERVGTPI